MASQRAAPSVTAMPRQPKRSGGFETFVSAPTPLGTGGTSASASDRTSLGELLRAARAARGLSQMELSLRIGVSQRHLGFLEVNRSRPSRGMLLTILDELKPPQSIRNATLIAAGFAPEALAVRAGTPLFGLMQNMLDAHDPLPAVVFDAHWYAQSLSVGGRRLCQLLMPRARSWATQSGGLDMIDAVADPAGFLAMAREPERAAAILLAQFWTEAWARPALFGRVKACDEELRARYGRLDDSPRDAGTPHIRLCFDTPIGVLRFSCFQSIPGLPQDISTMSHRIELWYPEDQPTRAALDRLAKADDTAPTGLATSRTAHAIRHR
jgi:transcriptional regulator with XRE-family HTH domain